ncbi:hypothetical protein HKX48_005320 [Thoreauomyces humboldtii]|nr:hypothetical protein HKX48_005320 [Thoreauomyces humboldtii]
MVGQCWAAQLVLHGCEVMKIVQGCEEEARKGAGEFHELADFEEDLKRMYAEEDAKAKADFEVREKKRLALQALRMEEFEEQREAEQRKEQEKLEQEIVDGVAAAKKDRDHDGQEERKSPPTKKAKLHHDVSNLPSRRDVAYTCVIPELTNQWSGSPMTMKIAKSETGGLWGEFDFGIVSGYLRCTTAYNPKRDSAISSTLTFTWRGADTNGNGELTFGSNNSIVLTWLGEKASDEEGTKLVSGWFEGSFYDRCKISARRQKFRFEQMGPSVHRIRRCKDAYRNINEGEYERQNVERWCRWVPPAPDGAIDPSDTSGAGSQDEEEESSDEEDQREDRPSSSSENEPSCDKLSATPHQSPYPSLSSSRGPPDTVRTDDCRAGYRAGHLAGHLAGYAAGFEAAGMI